MPCKDHDPPVRQQIHSILSCFTLPEAVATRIAASNDNGDQEALTANSTLPVEAAVLIGKTSRSRTALQNVLYIAQHPDILHAVLSQRRETRTTVLSHVARDWNMDKATQLTFVDRALPTKTADEYLKTRRWFPEPASKAVLRASAPVAVEYLAELAATDLDDDTLANVAAAVIENIDKLQRGHKLEYNQQKLAARRLAEACWLRPVIKTAALNSDAATAVVALTQIGLTADETAVVVTKLDSIDAAMAVHAAKQLLTNPTVTSETRQQIADQYPTAAADAAAVGAHRPGTTITDGQQLRNVDDLAVIDKAVAGTLTLTHLADLIEHPATTQDPHILHRLINLSKTQVDEAGPVMRKLMAHIAQLRADNELPETFDKTTAAYVWRRVQRQTADCNAARDATAQKGTHTRREVGWHGHGRFADTATADNVAQEPLGQVRPWQLHTLGKYWSRQLGDGISDESATAWQTALDMADAVPEQSSVDILKVAKTLGANT